MKNSTIRQILAFSIVGCVNLIIDLTILNILIFSTGLGKHGGMIFSIFKAISFTAAATNSYFFNKFWVFKGSGNKKEAVQFSSFFIISLVGALINIITATLFVTHITPVLVSRNLWPTAGALCGSLAGMTWNFLGYKYLVFGDKKKVSEKVGF